MLPCCRREDSSNGTELGSAAAKPSSSVVSSLTDLHPPRSQRQTRYTVRSTTTWHSANTWDWMHSMRHIVWELRLCPVRVRDLRWGKALHKQLMVVQQLLDNMTSHSNLANHLPGPLLPYWGSRAC